MKGLLNESKNMVEESTLFKIRKQVPLLSQKLIYGDQELEIPDDALPHIKKVLNKEKHSSMGWLVCNRNSSTYTKTVWKSTKEQTTFSGRLIGGVLNTL